MNIESELLAVVTALDEAGIRHAICGGLAVAVHGFPRATKDIDLLILREDTERAVQILRPLGYSVDAGRIPFKVGTPQENEVRRVSKVEDTEILTIDLLQVFPVYEGVWDTVEVFQWQGREVTVVSAQGLARMKRLSGRPKDLLDLQELGLDDESSEDS